MKATCTFRAQLLVIICGLLLGSIHSSTLSTTGLAQEVKAKASSQDNRTTATRVPANRKLAKSEKKPVDFDFEMRDALPQTDVPKEKWETKWGPAAKKYPEFKVPEGVKDPITYQHKRVVAVAMKYRGLPYMHKHIPACGGLDCSNFTSWVYNYGFGIQFPSGVVKQAETAGRRLRADEKFEPGDLLFQTNREGNAIAHVVIYVGENKVIDACNEKVDVREFRGWYKDRLSHVRRVIE